MKKHALISALALFGTMTFTVAFAQERVDVKGVDAGEEGTTTTIEVTKKKTTVEEKKAGEALWETQEGSNDIEGEAGATNKDGKANWKKACEDWKKEFRADNKENKIVTINCGSATCTGDAGSKVCTSKATYKIKTKMN